MDPTYQRYPTPHLTMETESVYEALCSLVSLYYQVKDLVQKPSNRVIYYRQYPLEFVATTYSDQLNYAHIYNLFDLIHLKYIANKAYK
jgi:hypothetical protein